MLHISLFSGGGGFDLASEWMGWKNIASCEINPFGRRILQYYWPDAYHHDDIKTLTYEKLNEEITKRLGASWRTDRVILTGGFPCQPFSHAGKRGGSEDDRFLWPEAMRAVREIQPECIVFENVTGLFTILQPGSLSEVESKEVHLFCENEEYPTNSVIERVQRRIIGTIIEEIRAEGYSFAEHFDGTPILLCIPACATGAPHRRDRIWFVAYSQRDSNKREKRCFNGKEAGVEKQQRAQDGATGKSSGADNQLRENGQSYGHAASSDRNSDGERGRGLGKHPAQASGSESEGDKRERIRSEFDGIYPDDPDSHDPRLERSESAGDTGGGRPESYKFIRGHAGEQEHWFEAATRLCVVDDEFPRRLDAITLSRWRIESLKMAGNAVDPDVVYEIFKAIESTYAQSQQ